MCCHLHGFFVVIVHIAIYNQEKDNAHGFKGFQKTRNFAKGFSISKNIFSYHGVFFVKLFIVPEENGKNPMVIFNV